MGQINAGKLRIGDDWNAITIIALSQTNPLKAIAEFVENSIDAGAKNVNIIKGRLHGEPFLKVIDNGHGIDDFKYVATHIGDSIKRKLKKDGIKGIQGEFGIGLLSFWTVGSALTINSTGGEGVCRQMKLVKNNPAYSINEIGMLFERTGTELLIKPILPGIKQLSCEKIQNYLASELRDRITRSGAEIKITDHTSRREYLVEPRKFKGILLHNLPEVKNPLGEVYYEIYLTDPSPDNKVGLYKTGTRVLPSITQIEEFSVFPWTSGYLEGIVDASFLQLTPGTRDGIIYDEAYESFFCSMEPLTRALNERIEAQKNAEEDKASRTILQKITKAIREALFLLPENEYEWLNVKSYKKSEVVKKEVEVYETEIPSESSFMEGYYAELDNSQENFQGKIFDIPGPLYLFIISPGSAVINAGEKKRLKAVPSDKNGKVLDSGFDISWRIADGGGSLSESTGLYAEYKSSMEPGIAMIEALINTGEISMKAECYITVTKELFRQDTGKIESGDRKGLPGYTFQRAAGELWRSRYDADHYIVIINNGHADFIYASRNQIRKLRYITRLFFKELVIANFPEAGREQLIERLIELQLYAEENLK